jgi:hypothetical protein
MCVFHYTLMLACLSFFIFQICCISTIIISRANSRALPLLMIVGSSVILRQTHILKLADPFRETLMHSRGVLLYKIVYIIELKCTILSIFLIRIMPYCRIVVRPFHLAR